MPGSSPQPEDGLVSPMRVHTEERPHHSLPSGKAENRPQASTQQEAGIDGGQLATAGAPPGRHVEEMIEEALVPCHVRARGLRSVVEEPQCRQRSIDCADA